MNRAQVQEMYLSFLDEEGYKGSIDDDGDVFFKYEGGVYYFFVDDNDDKFLQMVYPQFWSIEDDEEYQRALEAANHINLQYKIGKIIILPEGRNTAADVGLIIKEPEDFKIYFERALEILQGMANDFAIEMQAD